MQKIYCFLLFFLACSSYDYDFLLFVAENAGTVCQMKTCKAAYQGNEVGGIINMHGLWPNYNNGSWPSFCGNLSTEAYADSKISSSILTELNNSWVGLYSDTSDFRNHEWEKHGSCYEAALTQSSNSVNKQMNDFFSTTMDIKKTLDLQGIIFDSSKIANDGETYWNSDELQEALEKATGVTKFGFNCRSGSPQKLYTLEFCLSKELQFIDCPSSLSFVHNCTSGNIAVPTLNKH